MKRKRKRKTSITRKQISAKRNEIGNPQKIEFEKMN